MNSGTWPNSGATHADTRSLDFVDCRSVKRGCGNVTANATEVLPVLRYMASRWDMPKILEDRRGPPKKCHMIVGTIEKGNLESCPPFLGEAVPAGVGKIPMPSG